MPAPCAPLVDLRAWLTAPVDAVGLIAFRVAFGVLMVGQSLKFMRQAGDDWLAPRLLFPYEGFEWVRPWPGVGLQVHCALMALAAAGVAAGVRACAPAFGALFAYTVLLDQTHYNNHYYLIVLLSGLLALVGPGGAAPRWKLLLVQAQLVLMYTFAGVAKLNLDWLAGEPLRHWLAARAAGSLVEPLLRLHWLPVAICWAGAAFDLTIGPLLLWRRTRTVALAAAAAFHLTNAFLFEIGVFPWLMLGSLALWLPPEVVRRFVRAPLPDRLPERLPASRRRETLGLAAAGVYLLVQVALPLRHWLYPGDVAWSEEGHRFAWRMKLRDKQVDLTMRARDAQGREWPVDVAAWTTPKQRDEAAMRPLLLWQLARRVREDLEAERGQRVEVFVRARGTLNFRERAQDLIDPQVDLSRAPYGAFEAAPWIVALRDE